MSAWWECEKCGYEWSAACGDGEVPEICECGGKVSENAIENEEAES